ncbi:MAG TPA: radical SAM family heme chaperone HemW [Limnobacter sp.]|uniref:radical SAM family heme chaperone HemW n=1 Tax=Limnobacter sp. TaxID=2003368 RepID=UPI002E36B170|nr:radical SAM family heme chaperone HemW [Limnobacter sp.]HEX5485707.1 radical SAM family heme chaperone HemW [Limnobacter sp.]
MALNLVTQIFKPSDLTFTALPPLSLYIHLPWCVKKCPYCDFNSHLAQGSDRQEDHGLPIALQRQYLNALIADLDAQLPKVWGRKLHTIFIGGGTPSLFHPELIDELLGAVRARLGMPGTGEITMEANPGTFEQARFEGFKKAGVSRLSIGVQSFSDSHLSALGRIHQGRQAVEAAESAIALFDEVNLDLMYGLPDQTPQQALADLQQAIELGPTHLSLYQLTLEPNTQFAVKPPVLPAEETLADIEDAVHAKAAAAGYQRYEVSAFSKPGHRCQHNLNYWTFGDYLGIGAGAHGKITYPNRVERETRLRNPQAYMQEAMAGGAGFEVRELKATELPFEFMLNALRLMDGVPEQYFTERCGRPVTDLQAPLREALGKQLMHNKPGVFQPTELGIRFLNDLQSLFLR